jgi:hypothetical protein
MFNFLMLLISVFGYDREYILECYNLYPDHQELKSLCIQLRHYQSMWEDCEFYNF